MSVLIVEDNSDLAQVLADMLGLLGWQAQIAHTPIAAIQALRKETPSLILLDYNLPGINGVEVLHYIKREPLAKDIAVVFISLENKLKFPQAAIGSGSSETLKPSFSRRLVSHC